MSDELTKAAEAMAHAFGRLQIQMNALKERAEKAEAECERLHKELREEKAEVALLKHEEQLRRTAVNREARKELLDEIREIVAARLNAIEKPHPLAGTEWERLAKEGWKYAYNEVECTVHRYQATGSIVGRCPVFQADCSRLGHAIANWLNELGNPNA